MQENKVEAILNRLNQKLNHYCPSNHVGEKDCFPSQNAISVYRNTHSLTETMLKQECSLPVIMPKLPSTATKSQLDHQRHLIIELKEQNKKLTNEIDKLSRRVERIEKRAASESMKKKKEREVGKIESKNQIKESFSSNILVPKLKKKTIKRKRN